MLTLAPVFNVDFEQPQLELSENLCLRILTNEEVQVIRENENRFRALPLNALTKLKFAIACITEVSSPWDLLTQSRATKRINLVIAAFRLWSGVNLRSPLRFQRIEVSNVLYNLPIGDRERESLLKKINPFSITKLSSPEPFAVSEVNRFSKADAEAFAQLFRSMEKDNQGNLKVAFQRLKMFSEEEWPEKIIDAMIAFEALYVKRGDKRSKSEQIASGAAKLIGQTPAVAELLHAAYKLRNRIVHGEDVTSDHWNELTRLAIMNDPDLKSLISEPTTDSHEELPPNAPVEAIGNCLCESISAKLTHEIDNEDRHAREGAGAEQGSTSQPQHDQRTELYHSDDYDGYQD